MSNSVAFLGTNYLDLVDQAKNWGVQPENPRFNFPLLILDTQVKPLLGSNSVSLMTSLMHLQPESSAQCSADPKMNSKA